MRLYIKIYANSIMINSSRPHALTVTPSGFSVLGIFQAKILEQLPFPIPDHPDSGIEATSLVSPALAGRIFTTSAK